MSNGVNFLRSFVLPNFPASTAIMPLPHGENDLGSANSPHPEAGDADHWEASMSAEMLWHLGLLVINL